MLNKTRRGILTLVLTAALIVGGIYFFTPKKTLPFTSLAQYQSQIISWSSCKATFQCGKLQVPINYFNMNEGTFSLALLRLKAKNQGQKLGSLVLNPGGPGASGIEYALSADYIVSPAILARYDMVGFDPRGIGESAPIRCLTDKETDQSFAEDSKPDNPKELAKIITRAREYIAKCQAKNKFMMFYSTANSARDMDLLRSALGDKKLNYLGKSYGTYMGTLYAQLFPSKVWRLILDGAIDPEISGPEQNIAQSVGFDRALEAFVVDCLKHSGCPLPGPEKSAIASIIALIQSTSRHPLKSDEKRPVTESLLVLGIATALYDSGSGWPLLRSALKEAQRGEGSKLLSLSDQYTQRNRDGSYANNEADASMVIDCLDWPDRRTTAQIQSAAKTFAVRAPVFGPYLAYSALACQHFPRSNEKNIPIKRIVTTPILIIGTTRDPATPYQWAEGLHKIIENSRLISLNADGHTGQGRGSDCVDLAVEKYLLSGALPNENLHCSL